MNQTDWEVAEEEDRKNKGPKMSVEMSFNYIFHKILSAQVILWIIQSGRSNWPYICCLWDLQILFYKLFTIKADIFGTEPEINRLY